MPKSEHRTVLTTLDVARVKGLLSSVLSGATVEPLNQGPLDADAALALVASQSGGLLFSRSPFGPGTAVAQVVVEDHGSTRSVELIVVGETFGELVSRQASAGGVVAAWRTNKGAPDAQAGRNMVDAILQALEAADPDLRRTQ